MNDQIQIASAIAVPVIGFVVWLVRLEGRINLADQRHNDMRDDLAEIKADVKKLLVKL